MIFLLAERYIQNETRKLKPPFPWKPKVLSTEYASLCTRESVPVLKFGCMPSTTFEPNDQICEPCPKAEGYLV